MVKQNQLVGGSVTGQTAPELLPVSFAGQVLEEKGAKVGYVALFE
jgi:hypothetical protein